MTLAISLMMSILTVWLMNKFQSTRELLKEACPVNRHHSFILDLTLLLPLVGLLVETVARRIKNSGSAGFFPFVSGVLLLVLGSFYKNQLFMILGFIMCFFLWLELCRRGLKRMVFEGITRQALYATAIAWFLAISGSLYLDYLNFSFLAPLLGHPEAWNGNHFMWNSGIEVLGLKPIVDTTVPTYQNFWGFWNLLALVLLGPVYIWVMTEPRTWILLRAYARLRGLLFGYTEKQTGISALFFERKTR